MKRLNILLGLIALLLAALPAAAQDSTPEATSESGANRQVAVTLHRDPCFGACPVYTVTIYTDGTVVYEGERFVDVTGEQTTQIEPAVVEELVANFEAAGYFDWQDEYTEMHISDLPTVTTSVTRDGVTKQIVRYAGDDSAPLTLPYLENYIDLAAGTGQWTGAATAPTAPNSANAPVITLERQACFGMCPIYGLSLFADGTVVYVGIKNVGVTGVQVGQVDPGTVDMLTQMMTVTGYFDWQDEYTTITITDQSTVITSLSTPDNYKMIVRYGGDANAPIGLTWLEDQIDRAVDSAQWVKP